MKPNWGNEKCLWASQLVHRHFTAPCKRTSEDLGFLRPLSFQFWPMPLVDVGSAVKWVTVQSFSSSGSWVAGRPLFLDPLDQHTSQERKWRSSEGYVAFNMGSGPDLNGQSSSDILLLSTDVLKDALFYEKSPQIMQRWGSIWLLSS
jgi:hypothetical protein